MNRRQFNAAISALIAGQPLAKIVSGDEPMPNPNDDKKNDPTTRRWNIKLPTFGGKQIWGDQWFHGMWRIQRNALSARYRLLDEKDHRHAWGTFDQCRNKFEEIRKKRKLPPMEGKAVIALHGLIRSRSAMAKMSNMLRSEGNYTVFNMSYASTRLPLAEHANALGRVVRSLEGITEISFVCHSLGNLVVRRWLSDNAALPVAAKPNQQDETAISRETRVQRMVMLGPPNHQPEIASKATWLAFSKQIGGDGLQQLASGWSKLAAHLATPSFEFGILAGGKGDAKGYNPLVPGDDDMVVSVATTKLAGAKDFRILPVVHANMMNNPVIQKQTLSFLQNGWFESEAKLRPLKEV